MKVDYTDKNQLATLATAVDMLTDTAKAKIATRCLVTGLMVPPFFFRLVGSLMSFHRKVYAYEFMFSRNPDLLAESWGEITEHMVNGKDRTDLKSAGGWNKDELSNFLSLVERFAK